MTSSSISSKVPTAVAQVVDFSDDKKAIESRRQEVYDRLNRMGKAREQAKVQRKLEAKHEKGSTRQDNIMDFNQRFDADSRALRVRLEGCADKMVLEECRVALKGLSESVASVAYFLPSYDQRISRETVSAIQSLVDAAEQRTAPKKKFSFRKKKATSTPKPKPTPPAATTTTTTTTATASGSNEALLEDVMRRFEANVVKMSNKSNECIRLDASVAGKDVSISHLTDCDVFINVHLGAVRLDHVTRCRMVLGATGGSVFVDYATDCEFAYASLQTRIHHTRDCSFYVYAGSGPIIEDATGLGFAPCDVDTYSLHDAVRAVGLEAKTNRWEHVEDFKWLRQQQSPNWFVIPPADRRILTMPPPATTTTTTTTDAALPT